MGYEKKTTYNKLIGRIGNEYYYLDYTFEHNDTLKGAVGDVLLPLTYEEADYQRQIWDEDGEYWRMAVDTRKTTMGLDEWREYVLSIDGDEVVFDFPNSDAWDALMEKIDPKQEWIEIIECIGAGRIFKPDMEWDELFEPELWQEILKFETL